LKTVLKQRAQAASNEGTDFVLNADKQQNNAEKDLAIWRRKLDDMKNKSKKKKE